MSTQCTVPPPGWECSRPGGHPGPCAARQVLDTSAKPRHDLRTAQLSLRELLTGEPNRLRHVVRFGNCHKIQKESVAEHCFYTVFYAFMIGCWLRGNGFSVDMGVLLAKATIHDMEEARSGDFPRPFKYSSPEIKAALDRASIFAFNQCMGKVVGLADLDELRDVWEASKNGTIEGRIVALADYLSVVGYLWLEVQGSNLTMQQHVNDMAEYAKEFEKAEYDPMRPLVNEAKVLVEEFLTKGGPK